MSSNAIELINNLPFEPSEIAHMKLGFSSNNKNNFLIQYKLTQKWLRKISAMMKFQKKIYSYGKWHAIPIKGILSPCNDWMQSLTKLPLTSKIFTPFEIVSIIAEMKWKYYAPINLLEGIHFIIDPPQHYFLIDIFWLHYHTVNETTKLIVGNIFNCIMTLILFLILFNWISLNNLFSYWIFYRMV